MNKQNTIIITDTNTNAKNYFESINKFIDSITDKNNTNKLSFDELYRANYNMTIQQNYIILNVTFETARNEILKIDLDKQKMYLNMLRDIFMYPIRMNVINKYTCVSCNTNVEFNKLYCNTHEIHMNHLNNIKNFTSFKNDGLCGGCMYENILNSVL